MIQNQTISVFASWLTNQPKIGTLYTINQKGKETYSFEYDNNWISNYSHIFLDPDLFTGIGRQFPPSDKKILSFSFGLCSR